MKTSLTKYKIGLGVIGLFVVGLLIYLLAQAGATKHDISTYKAASNSADKLTSYINDKGTIPVSLAAAGIKNVPRAVSYTKLSTEKFRFCVAYKTTSSGYDSGSAVSSLIYRGMYGSANDYSVLSSQGDSTYLYVTNVHTKGQNCQTIKPYLPDTTTYTDTKADSGYSATSNPYNICGAGYNYAWAALRISALTAQNGAENATVSVASYPPQTFKIDPKVQVFDRNCNVLALTDLAVGDMIDLYFSPYGAPITTIIKE